MNSRDLNKTVKNASRGAKKVRRYLNKSIQTTMNKEQDLIQDLKNEIASELGIIQQIRKKGFKVVTPKIEKLTNQVFRTVKKIKK